MKKMLTIIVIVLLFLSSGIVNKKVFCYSYAQNVGAEDIINDDVKYITDNVEYLTATYNKTDWLKNGKVEYPINQTDTEWKALDNHNEMIKACVVPDAVLSVMKTKELIQLLYDYPLLIDMYSYNSLEEGVMHLAEECNILAELCKREDFSVELFNERMKHKSVNSYEQFKEKTLIDSLLDSNEVAKIENSFDDVLKGNAIIALAANSPNLKEIIRVDTISIGNGKTTKGTVFKYAGKTWASEQNAEYRKTYPLATFVSSADNRYNCHSYAWYKQSTSNIHWIFDPIDFTKSGLYNKVKNAKIGYKIEYVKDINTSKEKTIHSGIVTNTNNLTVESKWGTGPLMIHKAGYCPYTSGISYKYYQKK
ncbi:MAG: hypothetical protein J6D02_02365 [Lachnospira sp.]|nr:hypothetical protein [Lachnospira sp.]